LSQLILDFFYNSTLTDLNIVTSQKRICSWHAWTWQNRFILWSLCL